jgi:transglutaminase-like putative cysteine protease
VVGVTWRIAIVHTTLHRYAQRVHSSYNEARIVPLTLEHQLCLEARVEIDPGARPYQYWDYWGTVVNAFDLHTPHAELMVRGRSVVETATPSVPRAGLSWARLAESAVCDRFSELLTPTAYVPSVDDELLEVTESLRSQPTPGEAAWAASAWVRDRLVYEPGVTDVDTSAAGALAKGRGVCQDFAHLTLALLRTLGIPARYISGYLHPNPDGVVGQTVQGQGHAWVEWWTGDWVAWDPTHGVPVGERHVVVGRGRDYADVPPLKGIYEGSPAVAHDVTVELTRTG